MIRQIVFLFVKRWHISLVLQCSRSHYDYDSSSFSLSRLPIDNSPSTATTSSASLFELSTTACFMGSVADDPSATSSGIALPTSSSSDAVQRSSRSTATTTQLDTNRTNYNTPTVLQRHGFVRRLRWLKLDTSSLNEATVCIFIVSNWYDISTFVECALDDLIGNVMIKVANGDSRTVVFLLLADAIYSAALLLCSISVPFIDTALSVASVSTNSMWP